MGVPAGGPGPGSGFAQQAEAAMEVAAINRQMRKLERRDLGLWALGTLVLWLLVAGLLLPLIPQLSHLAFFPATADWSSFEVVAAFLAVTIIFNAHALWQMRRVRATRMLLIDQLSRARAAEQLAVLDPLTRAYNRRYMEWVLQRDLRRAERTKSVVSFVMVDLDDFREVNTRFGHLAGDELLCAVAGLLQSTLRASDAVVRYGGDEFLLVLPDTAEDSACVVVERILLAARGWNLRHAQGAYRMSFSCGTASYRAGDELAQVLARADRDMYRTKATSKPEAS
jgi:diguanylate cyclase (GGDEF)-like protein